MKRAIIFLIIAIITLCSFPSLLLALPEGAVARLGKETVGDVTFSPDGKILVVASNTGIYLYDPITLAQVGYFLENSHWMYSVAFSPDGTLLASGSYDDTIILWDMKPYIGQTPHQPFNCDVNSDGVVNVFDLLIVSKNLGKSKPDEVRADVNKDGIVDILDLNIVIQHFGESYK